MHCDISVRSAKFGVVVCKASMLDCLGGGVNLPCMYVHCAISDRCANFDVVVFKASMLY